MRLRFRHRVARACSVGLRLEDDILARLPDFRRVSKKHPEKNERRGELYA